MLLAGLAIAIVVFALSSAQAPADNEIVTDAPGPAVPADHRVVSVPLSDRVPPLAEGDEVDLYFDAPESAVDQFTLRGTELASESGIVLSITESALAIAVPHESMGTLASAITDGSVLVVRR